MNIHREIQRRIELRRMNGCGNHGCYSKKVTGQGTNGPCSCAQDMSSDIVNFVRKNRDEFLKQIDYMDAYERAQKPI